VRRVAVAVPQVGDAALRGGLQAAVRALAGPCAGAPAAAAPLADDWVAMLAGRGPLLAAAPLRPSAAPPGPDRLGAALLALALLALVAELPLRRLGRGAAPGGDAERGGAGEDARAAARPGVGGPGDPAGDAADAARPAPARAA
jgi:hypothetical protein